MPDKRPGTSGTHGKLLAMIEETSVGTLMATALIAKDSYFL